MKKTRIITAALGLCLTASMIAGCSDGGSTGETGGAAVRIEGGQTQISVEASAAEAGAAVKGYSFKHNGYELGIGSTRDDVLTAMGEPYDEQQVMNCADDAMGTGLFYYEGRVYFEVSGKGGVTQIMISDPVIDCGGVSVGDTTDKITAAYGDPNELTDYICLYEKDGMRLSFELEGGKVVSISFLIK